MYIAHDGDGGSDVHHIALLHQQLLCFCAYRLDNRLSQQLLLLQALYALVEINGSCSKSVRVAARTVRGRDVHGRPGMVGFVKRARVVLHPRRAQGTEGKLVASRWRYRTIILEEASGLYGFGVAAAEALEGSGRRDKSSRAAVAVTSADTPQSG